MRGKNKQAAARAENCEHDFQEFPTCRICGEPKPAARAEGEPPQGTFEQAEKEGITKAEFKELPKLFRWQRESLAAFRAKFGVESNCQALDAIDDLQRRAGEHAAPGLREAASNFAARVQERNPEWFRETDTDFAEADARLRVALTAPVAAPGLRDSASIAAFAIEDVDRVMWTKAMPIDDAIDLMRAALTAPVPPRCYEPWCVLPSGHTCDHSNVHTHGPFAAPAPVKDARLLDEQPAHFSRPLCDGEVKDARAEFPHKYVEDDWAGHCEMCGESKDYRTHNAPKDAPTLREPLWRAVNRYKAAVEQWMEERPDDEQGTQKEWNRFETVVVPFYEEAKAVLEKVLRQETK